MALLLLVSLIWAFSFGLIGSRLKGVDPTAVATLRLALSLLVFLPFFRPRARGALALQLMGIGALQFGVMYLLYQRAYLYLPSHEVVLFTLTMPLYITLCDALVERRVRPRFLLAAALAIAGSVVVWFERNAAAAATLTGFAIMQASNLCFAAGQIAWRRTRARLDPQISDASVFALPYLGAVVASAAGSLAWTNWSAMHLTGTQWLIVAYLGAISSGACFFWWNRGATRVNAGTLAVFNNLKVPLGVACSLLFFGESANVPRLLAGAVVMALAVWLAEK